MSNRNSHEKLAALILVVILLLIAGRYIMDFDSKQTASDPDSNQMPSMILAAEKYLWAAIHKDLDEDASHGIASILSNVNTRHTDLIHCPIGGTRLAINPSAELWVTPSCMAEIAIVSRTPLHIRGNVAYQAIRFDGIGDTLAELPHWAK